MRIKKQFYFLRALELDENNVPRHTDLSALITQAAINAMDKNKKETLYSNGYKYVYARLEGYLCVDFFKLRAADEDMPEILDAESDKITGSIMERLEHNESLVEHGRMMIFDNGYLVCEHSQAAGGHRKPTNNLIGILNKSFNISLVCGPLVFVNELLSFIEKTQSGDIELRLLAPEDFFSKEGQILGDYARLSNSGLSLKLKYPSGEGFVQAFNRIKKGMLDIVSVKTPSQKLAVSGKNVRIYMKHERVLTQNDSDTIFSCIYNLYKDNLSILNECRTFLGKRGFVSFEDDEEC